MHFEPLAVDPEIGNLNRKIEAAVNALVRGSDRLRSRLRVGGQKAPYDDSAYEFEGGPGEAMRRKHYDKSLRHLWKARPAMPWSSFRDASSHEMAIVQSAEHTLSAQEREEVTRIRQPEFKAMLDREYSVREQQAIVSVLSLIGHGEAYAWLVSAELLSQVKSTGARAALTMQVMEEAKHFLVLRELVLAFGQPVPRMSGWEYLLLERTFKSSGLEMLFGMNIVVEAFALNLFGMMSHLPGLEVLRLFHLDESRHTALPANYFKEFPLSWWASHSPRRQLRRLSLVLPALPILPFIEADLAVLGIDTFDFGGSMARKIFNLADRTGFRYALPRRQLEGLIEWMFNTYCARTRQGHVPRRFIRAETTRGEAELAVEAEIFAPAAHA